MFELISVKHVMEYERRKLEEQFKQAMYESIAHELRTPLNSIIGNNDFLFEYLCEEGIKYLESS